MIFIFLCIIHVVSELYCTFKSYTSFPLQSNLFLGYLHILFFTLFLWLQPNFTISIRKSKCRTLSIMFFKLCMFWMIKSWPNCFVISFMILRLPFSPLSIMPFPSHTNSKYLTWWPLETGQGCMPVIDRIEDEY